MPLERRRMHFSGRVQGVGFRATARWLAAGYDVAGYVRNLPDGRVELLVEGETDEINGLLEAVHEQLGAFIREAHATAEPPGQPPLSGFTVRF